MQSALPRRFNPYTRYGITMQRVEEQDLELLRRWRNDPSVTQFMIYREHITEQQQRDWYRTIDNDQNWYAIIHWKGEPIGVSHVKHVDPSTGVGEGGMIIWDARHQNSLVPMRAALAGNDWVFGVLKLRALTARVLRENNRALRYNRALGYVFDHDEDDGRVLVGTLTAERYASHTRPLRETIEALPEDEG